MSIYEGEGYFSIGKDVHSNIDEGLGLVDISNDGFLRIILEKEVDLGFGKRDKKKLVNKNYG